MVVLTAPVGTRSGGTRSEHLVAVRRVGARPGHGDAAAAAAWRSTNSISSRPSPVRRPPRASRSQSASSTAAPKVSPAPIVSAISVSVAVTSTLSPEPNQVAPRGPRVTTTADGPSAEEPFDDLLDRLPGVERVEVLVGGLHQVGSARLLDRRTRRARRRSRGAGVDVVADRRLGAQGLRSRRTSSAPGSMTAPIEQVWTATGATSGRQLVATPRRPYAGSAFFSTDRNCLPSTRAPATGISAPTSFPRSALPRALQRDVDVGAAVRGREPVAASRCPGPTGSSRACRW